MKFYRPFVWGSIGANRAGIWRVVAADLRIGRPNGRWRRRVRRGALLLEVLVALTILVFALGMLGAQLVGGMRLTHEADLQTRATQLSDRLLALLELDRSTAERFFGDRQVEGDFGEANPGWFWRAAVEPTDVEGLGRVTLEILHQSDPRRPADIRDAVPVRRVHLLKADPARIDLAEDFGVDEQTLEEFAANIPIPGLDPHALDPQALVSLDPATLLELLPQLLPLIQQFAPGLGQRLEALSSGGMLSDPNQLRELLEGGTIPPDLADLSGQLPQIPGLPPGQIAPPRGGRRPPGDLGGRTADGSGRPELRRGGSRGGLTIDELNRNRGGSPRGSEPRDRATRGSTPRGGPARDDGAAPRPRGGTGGGR